jgi:hypothetical protein
MSMLIRASRSAFIPRNEGQSDKMGRLLAIKISSGESLSECIDSIDSFAPETWDRAKRDRVVQATSNVITSRDRAIVKLNEDLTMALLALRTIADE